MSRSIRELLPDVRVAAAGVPEFLAMQFLTRSLSEFLDRSEAWREWLPVRVVGDINDGVTSWVNHLDDPTQRWARIKRIDKMRWHPSGREIKFKTSSQLQGVDPEWRTRTGTESFYYTNEGEAPAAEEGQVSGHQIRLYPIPNADVDPAYGVQPHAVIVTDVVTDMGFDAFDEQIPTVPDRVFYAWREAIVSGALSRLYLMPGKDWTDQKLSAAHRAYFEAAALSAKSRADAEYGHPVYTTTYGGL